MNPNSILSISREDYGMIGVRFDRWDGPHAQYEWIVEIENMVYSGTDLRMGARSTTTSAEALRALLDFLGAFAEAVAYSRRSDTGESDNLDLFPEELQDWAYGVGSDEFALLAYDVAGEES